MNWSDFNSVVTLTRLDVLDYYLEDIVHMLNFFPSPDTRKKKNKKRSNMDDDDDDDEAEAGGTADDVSANHILIFFMLKRSKFSLYIRCF